MRLGGVLTKGQNGFFFVGRAPTSEDVVSLTHAEVIQSAIPIVRQTKADDKWADLLRKKYFRRMRMV